MIIPISLLLFKPNIGSACKYATARGTFDLAQIAGTSHPTPAPNNEEYDFTFCANNAAVTGCTNSITQKACALQRDKHSYCYSLATWDNSGKATSTSDGFSLEFANGSPDFCLEPRGSTFIFQCDETVEVGDIATTEESNCHYTITVPTKYVCPEYITHGGASGSGLSGGSIFLIVLLVLISVYCIGGLGFNKYKGSAGGLQLIPQASFWCALLPFWVKSGCKASWACIVRLFFRIKAKLTGSTLNRGRTDTDADGSYENLE